MADSLILYCDDSDAGLDLSAYVDLDEGGFNPGDESVREPIFGGNGSSYGAPFLAEKLNNREVTCALLLNATTQDALAALFVGIQQRLDGDNPHLGWTRDGATKTAYFRIRYGRLLGSERYDTKREGQARMAKRLLVLACAPYAEANRRRTADLTSAVAWATGAGWTTWPSGAGQSPSHPAMTAALPSIGGDVPAGLRLALGIGTAAGASVQRVINGFAAGLTRQASYLPFFMTAGALPAHASGGATFNTGMMWYVDGTAAGPTSVGSAPGLAPGGTNGNFLHFHGTYTPSGISPVFAKVVQMTVGLGQNPSQATQAGSYFYAIPRPGRYRAFLAARLASNSSDFQVFLRDFNQRTAVATLTGNVATFFRFYDMGDFDVFPGQSGHEWSVAVGRASVSGATFYASPAVQISGLALVPKDIGYQQWDQNQAGITLGAGGLLVFDGIEADREYRWGVATIGSLPIAPFASVGIPMVDEVRGDRPLLPYTPSGQGSALYLVSLVHTTSVPDNQPMLVATVAQDRYLFSP